MQNKAPNSPPRRRLAAAERRETLLDTSLSLFSARGYELTSVAEIATAANVTKPVLYEHFRSKEALYAALLEREGSLLMAALIGSFDAEAPVEERLRTLAQDTLDFARRRPASSQLLFHTPSDEARIRGPHERLRNEARVAISRAILADPLFQTVRGLSRKASAELLADLQIAILVQLVHWALEHPRMSSRSLSEVFVDLLWRGLDGSEQDRR